MLNFSRCDRT